MVIREKIAVVVIICILLVICGAIMLGIGISKLNKKCDDNKSSTTYPTCTTQKIGSILHFSIKPGIPWNETYTDLSNPEALLLLDAFSSNITSILTGQAISKTKISSNLMEASSAKVLKVSPDYLADSANSTTVFYGTIAFDSSIDAKTVQDAIVSSGMQAMIENSSRKLCNDLDLEPTPPPQNFGEFPCDPRSPERSVIFMVDVAVPTDPKITEEQKLASIRAFLQSLTPPADQDWTGLSMSIGVFSGSTAFLPNNWLCSNISCWTAAISQVRINATSESHNVTRAFEFIRDEFSNPQLQLKQGTARALIILADGFEYDNGFGEKWCRELSTIVAQTFYVSTILINSALSVRSTFSGIVPSGFRYVNLDYFDQLELPDIKTRALWWMCLAQPLATAPPEVATPTFKPIDRLTTLVQRPTLNPDPTGIPILTEECDSLQVLFLVDLSQSVDSGFPNTISFIRNFVNQAQGARNSTFAYISFNDKVRDQTALFLSTPDFDSFLNKTAYINAYSSYAVGFNALNEFYEYFDQSWPSTVIFITPGNPIDASNIVPQQVVETMRANGTQFIALLTVPNSEKQALLNTIFQPSDDSLAGPSIVLPTGYSVLPDLAKQTVKQLACQANATKTCNVDLIFLVEDSEIVDDVYGQNFARGAIKEFILVHKQSLSLFDDHIGIITYSNPANYTSNYPSRTFIVLDLNSSNSYNAQKIYDLTGMTFPIVPPGSYSDLKRGLELADSVFTQSTTSNAQAVVIIGRGETQQPEQDCCADPTSTALGMRHHGIIFKGAVIGSSKNEAKMQQITGMPNFYIPNYSADSQEVAEEAGTKLASQIVEFRNLVADQGNCIQPEAESFCQEPLDIVLIIHMPPENMQDLFYAVRNFTANAFLNAFSGIGYGGIEKVTRLALFVYYGDNVERLQSLATATNLENARRLIESIPFVNHNYESCNLSLAYEEALEQFESYGRAYAAWTTIVISESLNHDDSEAAINITEVLHDKKIATFGLGTSTDDLNYADIDSIWQKYSLIDGKLLQPSTDVAAVFTANMLRDWNCAYASAAVTTTEPPPSTKQPGILPQKQLPSKTWPYICILVDVSANLDTPSAALNDEGFEIIRIFLINTLCKFKIDEQLTRVALVAFDGAARVVFHFNEHNTWDSLYLALTQDWQYGPAQSHNASKNLDNALQLILDEVYQAANGARPLKDNYLWIISTGADPNLNQTQYQTSLSILSQGKVFVMAMGVGTTDTKFLSTLSSSYVVVQDFANPDFGLASPSDLAGPLFVELTTGSSPPQPISRFNSDVIISIDKEMILSQLQTVQEFLVRFIEGFSVSQDNTRFALLMFDRANLDIIYMSQQFDKNSVLSNIRDIQPHQFSNISVADYRKMIDFVETSVLPPSVQTGKRADAPTYFVHFTANDDMNYSINTTSPFKSAYTYVLSLANLTMLPKFTTELATKIAYAYNVGANLLDWSIPTTGTLNPVRAFFDDLLADNQVLSQNQTAKLDEVAADIVVLVDFANLNASSYQALMDYVALFAARFKFGTFSVQFSALALADSVRYEFPLCPSIECFRNQTNSWQFEQASNSSLLTDALKNVLNTQLTPSNGWRNSKSFVMIFTAQDSFTWNVDIMDLMTNRLRQKNAFLYYIDMANSLPRSLRHYFDGYENTNSPAELHNGTTSDVNIDHTIITEYTTFAYPAPLLLSAIVADFVFAIDVSVATEDLNILEQTRVLLLSLLSGMTIGPQNSTMAVVLFNGDGVSSQSFLLNASSDASSLNSTIRGLTQPAPTNSTNLAAALDFIASAVFSPSNGYRNNLTFINFFIANQRTTSLDNSVKTIQALQSSISVNFYGFAMSADDNSESAVQTLRKVVPATMTAKQIRRTRSVYPDSDAIDGATGFFKYLINVYTDYVSQPTEAPTTEPPFVLTTVIPTVFPADLSNVFPLNRISTTVVFVIDSNIMMYNDTNDQLRNYLREFGKQFYYDNPQGSYLAFAFIDTVKMEAYNVFGLPMQNGGSINYNQWNDALHYPTLLIRTAPTFSISKALKWAAQNTREALFGSTLNFVVIVGNTSLFDSCDELKSQVSLMPNSMLYAYTIGDDPNLELIICGFNQFGQSDTPMQITIDDLSSKHLSYAISNYFEQNAFTLATRPSHYDDALAINVVFIIDSYNIDNATFQDTKRFIAAFADNYKFSNDCSKMQIAAMSYPDEKIGFNSSISLETFKSMLNSLSKSAHSGMENTTELFCLISQFYDYFHGSPCFYKAKSVILLSSQTKSRYGAQFDKLQLPKALYPIFAIDLLPYESNGAGWLANIAEPQNIYRTNGMFDSFDKEMMARVREFVLQQKQTHDQQLVELTNSLSSHVIFVVDTTIALDQNWYSILEFSSFPSTRFGFAFYPANFVIGFNDYFSVAQLENLIEAINWTKSNTSFDINAAFAFAAKAFGDELKSTPLSIVTYGRNQNITSCSFNGSVFPLSTSFFSISKVNVNWLRCAASYDTFVFNNSSTNAMLPLLGQALRQNAEILAGNRNFDSQLDPFRPKNVYFVLDHTAYLDPNYALQWFTFIFDTYFKDNTSSNAQYSLLFEPQMIMNATRTNFLMHVRNVLTGYVSYETKWDVENLLYFISTDNLNSEIGAVPTLTIILSAAPYTVGVKYLQTKRSTDIMYISLLPQIPSSALQFVSDATKFIIPNSLDYYPYFEPFTSQTRFMRSFVSQIRGYFSFPPKALKISLLFIIERKSFIFAREIINEFAQQLSILGTSESTLAVLAFGNASDFSSFAPSNVTDYLILRARLYTLTMPNVDIATESALLHANSSGLLQSDTIVYFIADSSVTFVCTKTSIVRGIGVSGLPSNLQCKAGDAIEIFYDSSDIPSLVGAMLRREAALFATRSVVPLRQPENSTYQDVTVFCGDSFWLQNSTTTIYNFFTELLSFLPIAYLQPLLRVCILNAELQHKDMQCFDILNENDINAIQFRQEYSGIAFPQNLVRSSAMPSTSIILAATPEVEPPSAEFVNQIKAQGSTSAIDLFDQGASNAYLSSFASNPEYLSRLQSSEEVGKTAAFAAAFTAIRTDYEQKLAFMQSLAVGANYIILIVNVGSNLTLEEFNSDIVPLIKNILYTYESDTVEFGAIFYSTKNDTTYPILRSNVSEQLQNISDVFTQSHELFDINLALEEAEASFAQTSGVYPYGYLLITNSYMPSQCVQQVRFYRRLGVIYGENLSFEPGCLAFGDRTSGQVFSSALTNATCDAINTHLGHTFYEAFENARNQSLPGYLASFLRVVVVLDANERMSPTLYASIFNYIRLSLNELGFSLGYIDLSIIVASSQPYLAVNNTSFNFEDPLPLKNVDGRTNLRASFHLISDAIPQDMNPVVVVFILQNQIILDMDMPSDDEISILHGTADVFGLNLYGSLKTAETLLKLTRMRPLAYDIIWEQNYLDDPTRYKSMTILTNFIASSVGTAMTTNEEAGSSSSFTTLPPLTTTMTLTSTSINPKTTSPFITSTSTLITTTSTASSPAQHSSSAVSSTAQSTVSDCICTCPTPTS